MNKFLVLFFSIVFVALLTSGVYTLAAGNIHANANNASSTSDKIININHPFAHRIIPPGSINVSDKGDFLAYFVKVISIDSNSFDIQAKVNGQKVTFTIQTDEKTKFFKQGKLSSFDKINVGDFIITRGTIVGDFSTSTGLKNIVTKVFAMNVRMPDLRVVKQIKKNSKFNLDESSIYFATSSDATSTPNVVTYIIASSTIETSNLATTTESTSTEEIASSTEDTSISNSTTTIENTIPVDSSTSSSTDSTTPQSDSGFVNSSTTLDTSTSTIEASSTDGH